MFYNPECLALGIVDVLELSQEVRLRTNGGLSRIVPASKNQGGSYTEPVYA